MASMQRRAASSQPAAISGGMASWSMSQSRAAWAGAALINRELKLVGVGSLLVRDAGGDGSAAPGNMFVPIDLLMPILGDLLADGRVSGPGKPWLGVAAEEASGELRVSRVTPESPAEKAGIQPGDVITTGTPPGVAAGMKPKPKFLKAGDEMHLWIAGLGEQKQKLVAA